MGVSRKQTDSLSSLVTLKDLVPSLGTGSNSYDYVVFFSDAVALSKVGTFFFLYMCVVNHAPKHRLVRNLLFFWRGATFFFVFSDCEQQRIKRVPVATTLKGATYVDHSFLFLLFSSRGPT